MKRLVPLLAAVLVLAPIPAHADAPCQPVVHDVTQIPNNIEHHTMLHSGAHTTACLPRTWAQVSVTIEQLQADGTWLGIASATSAPKYVSPSCKNVGCKSASVVVDRNPCISGTFRAVASNSAGTNIGPMATISCYSDPGGE